MVARKSGRNNEYDIIISGGGCAGLSLAWHLYRYGPADRSILLIEPEAESQNDRTWCYWNTRVVPFHHLRRHSWEAISLYTTDKHVTCAVSPVPGYHALESKTYRDWIHQDIRNHPYLEVRHEKSKSWNETADKVILQTDSGEATGDILFQNHTAGRDFFAESKFGIRQHFIGWEIEVDTPLFDPARAVFMDFRVSQNSGVAFMYVLPWSDKSALFEYTFFTQKTEDDSVYEDGIREYLSEHYNLNDSDYRITRHEQGVIPMVENAFNRGTKRVRPIGIISGAAKPSTGYAFSRIQKQCRFLADSMKYHRIPDFYPNTACRYRMYDIIMLHIIKNKPEKAVEAFGKLFANVSTAKLLRFLDEETGISEELQILNSVPRAAFASAAIKELPMLMKERLVRR